MKMQKSKSKPSIAYKILRKSLSDKVKKIDFFPFSDFYVSVFVTYIRDSNYLPTIQTIQTVAYIVDIDKKTYKYIGNTVNVVIK